MSLYLMRRGVRAEARRRTVSVGAPALRATATGNDGNTGLDSTSAITVPATVKAGDVMLVCGVQNMTANTISIAGGGAGVTWATLSGPDGQSGISLRSYLWKARATAGSAGSAIILTSTTTGRFPSLLWVGSGVTDAGLLTALAQVTSTSTAHPFPSVTVPSPGGWLLVGLGALRVGDIVAPTFAGGAPAGAVLDDESSSAAPAQPNLTASGLHVTSTVAAGARTPGAATSAATCRSNLYTVALAPA